MSYQQNSFRVFFRILIGLFLSSHSFVLAAHSPTAVPTFECIGLYWKPADGAENKICPVNYRAAGIKKWREAYPLWFDKRNREYRGSIVHLKSNTNYEIELNLKNTNTKTALQCKTWTEDLPIVKTIYLPERSSKTLTIDRSGTPNGYILYTPKPQRTTTIDVVNQQDNCIIVKTSYVIIRGLTLKNARIHGIQLRDNVHDVIIENCDISGWGRTHDDGWGENYDSAIYSNGKSIERITVQRNRIHHPRSDSNNWRELRKHKNTRHPLGPQAVCFWNSRGNHVIRYNHVYSDDDHQYNDIFGAGSNFSKVGFPNRDSDIYGNLLSHCWDDAIESEGANCNVRIWDNYMNEVFVGVACASTSIGPLYVWRNITKEMRVAPNEYSGGFLKTSDKTGGGKIYVFHNNALHASKITDKGKISIGASLGFGWGGPMSNVTTRNNILHVKTCYINDKNKDPQGDYDYDLYQGWIKAAGKPESHGIKAVPIYVENAGLKNHSAIFHLAPRSPGYDQGIRLPNFNDHFTGIAPDIGAHEANTPPLQFGPDADK
jgi:hypothetical protein